MARAKLPLHAAGDRTLHPGDRGTDVQAVQEALGLPATGEFDEDTEAAVKRLQRLRGLPQQGIVGPATWPFLLEQDVTVYEPPPVQL